MRWLRNFLRSYRIARIALLRLYDFLPCLDMIIHPWLDADYWSPNGLSSLVNLSHLMCMIISILVHNTCIGVGLMFVNRIKPLMLYAWSGHISLQAIATNWHCVMKYLLNVLCLLSTGSIFSKRRNYVVTGTTFSFIFNPRDLYLEGTLQMIVLK